MNHVCLLPFWAIQVKTSQEFPGVSTKPHLSWLFRGLGGSAVDKFWDLSTGCSFGLFRQTTGVIHRPCCLVGAGSALVFLPLTRVRERSAEWRYVSSLAPRRRRPRALAGTPPSGAPLVASSTLGPACRVRTGDFHPRDPGGFRRPSSEPYQPPEGGGPS